MQSCKVIAIYIAIMHYSKLEKKLYLTKKADNNWNGNRIKQFINSEVKNEKSKTRLGQEQIRINLLETGKKHSIQ
jgi:hypothetical protein